MNILEKFSENEKKVGMLLDIVSGCDNEGMPIDVSEKDKKYRRKIYNKVELLGIKAFDIKQYSKEEQPFMQKCIEKFNKINTK